MSPKICIFGYSKLSMAKIRFKSYTPNEIVLFPSDLGEKIPKDHPVRLLSRIVDGLDLTELIRTYKSGGTTPFHPRMLLKVVFYAYMNNIYSCRKIENAMNWNIQYMWLSGNQHPSFSTINRFRSEHMKDCVNSLFIQVVKILVATGQISLDVQYIDGTKIESAANKYTFVWKKATRKNKAKLEENIKGVLAQIDEGIAQDDAPSEDNGTMADTIDSEHLQQLIDKVNEENAQLARGSKEDKARARQRQKSVNKLQKQQKKLKEYEDKLDTLGPRNSYSKTDPDATFMRLKEDAMNNGQTKPAYNLQIGTENQYITNFAFYRNPGDTTTLPSFLTLDQARWGRLPGEVCADSGYGSEQNYEFMEDNGIEAYVKYSWFHKEQHRPFRDDPFRMENMYYNRKDDYYVCPMGQHMEHVGHQKAVSDNGYVSWTDTYRAQRCDGCPLRCRCFKGKGNRTIKVNHQLMRYKKRAFELLTSERGLFHRSKRPIEPEAVFGQIKTDKQYKRFRHRGFSKIQMDFGILAMAFNLQKLFKKAGMEQIKAAMEAFSALFGLVLACFIVPTPKKSDAMELCKKIRQLSDRNLLVAQLMSRGSQN
jgi:transposase